VLVQSHNICNHRVCKRWKCLISDRWLWKRVCFWPYPISKQHLKKVVRQYFSDSTLEVDICGKVLENGAKPYTLSNNILMLFCSKSPNLQTFKVGLDLSNYQLPLFIAPDLTLKSPNVSYVISSGITDGGRGVICLPGKLYVKTRPPLSLYFGLSIVLVCSRLWHFCILEYFAMI